MLMEPLRILFIEDDADDIMMMEEVLNERGGSFETHAIEYGDKVLSYLTESTNLPHVIVLDLNLPQVSGKEILHLIKSTPRLKNIPVVVLTTSSAPEDKDFSFREGAHSFFTKPASRDGYNKTIAAIVEIGLKYAG